LISKTYPRRGHPAALSVPGASKPLRGNFKGLAARIRALRSIVPQERGQDRQLCRSNETKRSNIKAGGTAGIGD
jgi:hypothetical protein